jgi:hypothetical protein
MTEAPEPEDKLDATATVVVNRPEDAPFDWHAIDWRRVEDDVRRLRQRIFTASKAGFCPPTSLRGLLEPGARKRARPGSEGGPAQQCVGPTRPLRQSQSSKVASAFREEERNFSRREPRSGSVVSWLILSLPLAGHPRDRHLHRQERHSLLPYRRLLWG